MQKPTAKEVTEYARSIGFALDGEAFCDFYQSKGWLVGKSPMKDWQACVRTWRRLGYGKGKQTLRPVPARYEETKPPPDMISLEQRRELAKKIGLIGRIDA